MLSKFLMKGTPAQAAAGTEQAVPPRVGVQVRAAPTALLHAKQTVTGRQHQAGSSRQATAGRQAGSLQVPCTHAELYRQ